MPNSPRLIWKLCDTCKRPFRSPAKDRRKFCSRPCAVVGKTYRGNQNQWGKDNPNWRGGRVKHSKGYIYVYAPWHPRASNGYVLEHILVAEEKLGRFLKPGETVHHEDENKQNNHPNNIEIFPTTGAHTKHHCKQRMLVKA